MRTFLIGALFLVFSFGNAQDFQGMAIYESKTSTKEFATSFSGNREITPEMQKMIEERMKKAFEKTFILNFDKSSSIYKEEEKIENEAQGGGGFRMMSNMMGGGGTYHKDVKKQQFTVNKEFFGKEFLVQDSLQKYTWVMGSESKKIGDYTCFKATAVVKNSESDFRNFRPKKEEEKKEGNSETKEKTEVVKDSTQTKKTNFTDNWEIPKEKTITAWYCPEIPINQGPEGYWGLPGLILEINDGATTILCSKLVLNSKEKVEIKAPKNGKLVTQKEYDEIVKAKMEEMREMRSQGGGRSMEFRMGR